MKSGVRKSGWPMPRLMMSRPCDMSCMARASTAKAFSSPIRSKAAMVLSMAFPAFLVSRAVQQNRPSNANAPAPGAKQEPRTNVRGSEHFKSTAWRNSADDVVFRAGLPRIGAAAAGRAIRIRADIGGRAASGRVLQALIRGLMMLGRKSRRREQRNAQSGQNQFGAEGFHFCLLRLRSPLAVYLRCILRCTSLVQSLGRHEIVNHSQPVNGNILVMPILFILRCNKNKNEADKFLNQHKGLRTNSPCLPLSAARNARRGVKSLY